MLTLYRRRLEAAVREPQVQEELGRLRTCHEVFGRYPSVQDLVDLAQAGNRNYDDKDTVLRVLLGEVRRETTLSPLLNLMFWNSLEAMFRQKRRTVRCEEDLFLRIQTAFFHETLAYPLEKRPRKIDVNLIMETRKKVTAWQRDEFSIRRDHRPIPDFHKGLSPLSDYQESKVFPEEMEAYLLDLVYRKVIDERQYDLLLETQVYRRMSQKEWAEARGVAYATVRSWYHRAEQAIRRHEKQRREELNA